MSLSSSSTAAVPATTTAMLTLVHRRSAVASLRSINSTVAQSVKKKGGVGIELNEIFIMLVIIASLTALVSRQACLLESQL